MNRHGWAINSSTCNVHSVYSTCHVHTDFEMKVSKYISKYVQG